MATTAEAIEALVNAGLIALVMTAIHVYIGNRMKMPIIAGILLMGCSMAMFAIDSINYVVPLLFLTVSVIYTIMRGIQ